MAPNFSSANVGVVNFLVHFVCGRTTIDCARGQVRSEPRLLIVRLVRCVRTMASSCNSNANFANSVIDDKPYQPGSFSFPLRVFGVKTVVKRSFQPGWFDKRPWLHYREGDDSALCFTCMKAVAKSKLQWSSNADSAFGAYHGRDKIGNAHSAPPFKIASDAYEMGVVGNCVRRDWTRARSPLLLYPKKRSSWIGKPTLDCFSRYRCFASSSRDSQDI